MNDPHVVALFYTVEHGQSVDYREAKPCDDEKENFSVRIEDKKVCFTLKAHYATEEEALEAVREYIERWEFAAGLERGPDKFKLVYQDARIVDRRPPPKRDGFAEVSGTFRSPGGRFRASISSLSQYPKPPSAGLTITPDVQSIYDRFMGYRLGREPLPSMAYFCLTMLEAAAGNRPAAARKYGIALKVLSKIGRLCDEKGGSQARKGKGVEDEFTPQEKRFLEKAMVVMIRRAAEVAHDPDKSRDRIKLSDLPDLV